MTAFQQQLEAMGSALLLIAKLPAGTIWGLTCTNDDDARSMSTLNIYVPEPEWGALAIRLGLKGSSQYVAGQYISYKDGSLLISLIGQE